MSYLFQSRACADVFMLQSTGDALLQALGREPAAQGIIEPDAMPDLLTRLQQKLEALEAEKASPISPTASYPETGDPTAHGDDASDDDLTKESSQTDTISARQRWWPFQDMLERSYLAQKAIVWGVASA